MTNPTNAELIAWARRESGFQNPRVDERRLAMIADRLEVAEQRTQWIRTAHALLTRWAGVGSWHVRLSDDTRAFLKSQVPK